MRFEPFVATIMLKDINVLNMLVKCSYYVGFVIFQRAFTCIIS